MNYKNYMRLFEYLKQKQKKVYFKQLIQFQRDPKKRDKL